MKIVLTHELLNTIFITKKTYKTTKLHIGIVSDKPLHVLAKVWNKKEPTPINATSKDKNINTLLFNPSFLCMYIARKKQR